MTTTAILCKARNETPYIEEWLDHHFSLGFDRVYFISTDSDLSEPRRQIDRSRHRSAVELLHYDDFSAGWQYRCFNEFLPMISEDWILVIDIDEFLYLNTFANITEYLEQLDPDIGQVQFPWLVLMSDNYYERRVSDILHHSRYHLCDHVKSMVRRDCLTRLAIHNHHIKGARNCLSSGHDLPARGRHRLVLSNPQFFSRHPFILHFFSRGHIDIMTRILDQQFFNIKCGDGEIGRLTNYLSGPADWSTIPTRYLLMKFRECLPVVNMDCQLADSAPGTDLQALQELFRHHAGRIVDLPAGGLEAMTEAFEQRYRLSEKLASQDLSGSVSLDSYLACKAQLSYIQRLRATLVGQAAD